MNLKIVSDDGMVASVACEGKITQERLSSETDPLIALLGHGAFSRKVLLDLEKTDYINSSGLSWLVLCHQHFAKAGGMLVVHSVSPVVLQVLQFVHLPSILHLADDEPSARALALGEKR